MVRWMKMKVEKKSDDDETGLARHIGHILNIVPPEDTTVYVSQREQLREPASTVTRLLYLQRRPTLSLHRRRQMVEHSRFLR